MGLSSIQTVLEDKLLGLCVLLSRILKKKNLNPLKSEAEIEITSSQYGQSSMADHKLKWFKIE